jgi:hypothetical protein
VDDAADVGMFSSLVLDSSDNPHISYYDAHNMNLKYVFWNGSNWVYRLVDNNGNVGQYAALALDASGNPHISYYDATFTRLKYARWNGSTWIIETVDNQAAVGEYTSLVVDSLNRVHISYYNATSRTVWYARWNGSEWILREVEYVGPTQTNVKQLLASDHLAATSIALDSEEKPHIAFYNWGTGHLRYAQWMGTAFTLQTIDASGDVGLFASLKIGANDLSYVGYHHNTNEDLMLAIRMLPRSYLPFANP